LNIVYTYGAPAKASVFTKINGRLTKESPLTHTIIANHHIGYLADDTEYDA